MILDIYLITLELPFESQNEIWIFENI